MKAQIQIHLRSHHLSCAAARFRLSNRKDLKYYENFDSLRDARQYLLDLSQDLEDTELGDDWLSYDSVTAYIVTEKEEMI
jgi:hypothetical protein